VRNRPAQRKADENATSKHTRQNSSISAVVNASRFAHSVVNGIKAGHSRPALGEVTTIAVNRRVRVFRMIHNIRLLTLLQRTLPSNQPARKRSFPRLASREPALRLPQVPSAFHWVPVEATSQTRFETSSARPSELAFPLPATEYKKLHQWLHPSW
jgi:hypothetical protein